MATTAPRRSFMMVYRAEDFPLHLLSLVLAGILIAPALPYRSEQALLIVGLAYLAVFFLVRHGAKFQSDVFRVVAKGVGQYPLVLARSWRTARDGVIPIIVTFALALTAEHFLRPVLAGTKWLLRPFPWQWAVWGLFLVVTLFRVIILIAHLLRASVVREVMEHSPQKKLVAVLSIQNHIFQAFVTGMVAHLCLVAPCVLFFMWTDPTYLREALLLSGYLLWTGIAAPLRKRKILAKPGVIANRLFYQNHSLAHQSRFYFTIFHGHHHDAIPSALLGSAAGTGFFENADRALTWLDPLNSIIRVQLEWAYMIAFDMIVHQYIPGVFPFSKTTIMGASHHVTHHFGSALPLGVIFYGYVDQNDMKSGYKPDNAVTRWFLSEVEAREKIDPERGRKFLSINDYVFKDKSAASSEDASSEAAPTFMEVPSGPPERPIPPLAG